MTGNPHVPEDLISVLAYAGLRPQEGRRSPGGHVRKRTFLIEQAVADGELEGQKTGKPPRPVTRARFRAAPCCS
jgi:hypothetical protein